MTVPLLPLADAQARLLALASPIEVETVPLLGALDRYLAEPLIALRTQPETDLSAMDGWAVSGDALPGPFRWNGSESAAGRPLSVALAPGEAARIFTGATMPAGADTVVMQEHARLDGDHLHLETPPPAGSNVRPRGMDFAAGGILADVGTRLNAAYIALAAMAGHGTLKLHRRPRVALFSTGDELVEPGAPADAGLPASNGVMLAALASQAGAEIIDLGIIRDDIPAIAQAFREAGAADLILTSGGVSVGDHDLVRPALQSLGAQIDFWRIALKPGKPLMAGRLDDTIVLGLPGNPVSAFVTAQLFALPLIRALAGDPEPTPPYERAMLGAPLRATGRRAEFVRARLVGGVAHPHVNQDSAALSALAASHALIHRPADSSALMSGDPVGIVRIA